MKKLAIAVAIVATISCASAQYRHQNPVRSGGYHSQRSDYHQIRRSNYDRGYRNQGSDWGPRHRDHVIRDTRGYEYHGGDEHDYFGNPIVLAGSYDDDYTLEPEVVYHPCPQRIVVIDPPIRRPSITINIDIFGGSRHESRYRRHHR